MDFDAKMPDAGEDAGGLLELLAPLGAELPGTPGTGAPQSH